MQLMSSALRGCASISDLLKTILYQHSHSKLPPNRLESEERDPIGKMKQLFSSYSINNVATQEITTSFDAKKPQPAPQPPSPAHVEIEVERRAVGLTLPCYTNDKLVHLSSSAYKWSGSIAHPPERISSKDGEDDPHGMMESFPQYHDLRETVDLSE
ncbi:hypothetical protein GcM1_206057 [Golovinomyces cichoracearum]|uniref:Uncharacterized protein n=1 Tax=Golovinomyces cichoracearum TaxID=62708 RepID=A0A420IWZ1_9PEZI|nr:hypothetical protein GcM1_206057 [Golovinomyces cichoracearum]